MKRFINFGKIGQFRNVIRDINMASSFEGVDGEGNPIYNNDKPKPVITVTGTEKIHGTNAAVCYSNPDGFWVQSRKNIITPEKDNAACAFNAYQNKEAWMTIINELAKEYEIDLDKYIISVYFEWCGEGIQKNSAVTGLSKRAMVFQHFKVSPIEPQNDEDIESARWLETMSDYRAGRIPKDGGYFWIPSNIYKKEDNIYNIMNFPYFSLDIDFNNPLLSQNEMIKLVEEIVEPNSPVGESFGKKGNVGEGIVFTFTYKDVLYRFKVKGEKHSKSKVKTLKPVDNEKEQAKIDFANYACSPTRLEQAWQNTFGINNEKMEPNVKETGTFLRYVFKDVMEEEQDVMSQKGLEPKDVNKMVSKIARIWFMSELDKYFLKGE